MKKATLLLLASIAILHLAAQTNNITGIGEIKINSQLASVLKLVAPKNNYKKFYTSIDFENYYMKNPGEKLVGELVKNTAKNDSFFITRYINYSNTPGIRIFFIPQYQISTHISADQVHLIFYKDQLADIYICMPDENFMNAFTFKYGKGAPLTAADKSATWYCDFMGFETRLHQHEEFGQEVMKVWNPGNGIICLLLKYKKDGKEGYMYEIFNSNQMETIYKIEAESINAANKPKKLSPKEIEEESKYL